MIDPFKITEPTCISFSGGRTSAYMLYRVLESNNGLPDDAIVCFANTGKECEETLEFVQACSDNWNVPINWIEYTEHEIPKKRFKVVDFESASRNGEPFFMSINQNGKPYLPNPVARICTINMKIRVIHHFLCSMCWEHNEDQDWIGIRADELRRASKISRDRTPLVAAGITKEDIGKFWKNNSFDLQLPNLNGTTYHGNCDLCFLKSSNIIFSLIREKPERADWWIEMENYVNSKSGVINGGGRFRNDRPTYEQMKKFAITQVDMFGDDISLPCYCGD